MTAFHVASASGAISRFAVRDNNLVRTSVTELEQGVSALTLHPSGETLYAAVGPTSSVAVFAVGADGALARTGTIAAAAPLAYLSASADGQTLFGASYSDGVLVTLDPSGETAARVDEVGTHPHCAVVDGDALWVAVLGDDVVLRIPLIDGRPDVGAAQRVTTPPAFGPRHLVVTDDAVLVLGERSGAVASIPRDAAEPDAVWSIVSPDLDLAPGIIRGPGENPSTDATGRPLIWAADLALSPDQQTLYTSERRSSQLGKSSVGERRLVTSVDTERQPRGIGLDPTGAYLLGTGELSDSVTLYDADLTVLDRAAVAAGALWVQPAH